MLFEYKYGGNTNIINNSEQTSMSFAPDTLREPTFFVGKLDKKIPFREAISALHHVVVSDLRFKPKDKTEYKAWAEKQEQIWLAEYMESFQIEDVKAKMLKVREELNESYKESNKILQPYYKARGEYFKYLYEKDKDAWFVLDPVITVHPDEVFFECFSQDESTYGKLSCSYNVFKEINEFECGTTNVDYSATLYNEFQKIRNYKETDFKIDPSGFEVQTTDEESYKEVKIDLPDTWVRGFLQVSSAMTLPSTTLDLHPMDIFSLCQFLRRFKEKKSPRSLRFVLEPNKPIKIIIEPWNKEMVFHRSIYTGNESKEIRIWGRRRILILERLIPIAKNFKLVLLGTGLPSFFIAELESDMTFTLGLSGWTSNDWSRAGNFDLMAPRSEVDDFTKKTVFNALKQNWFESSASLARRLNLDTKTVSSALASYTQAGRVIYDLKMGVYRVRELSKDPLPMDKLRFASEEEEKAISFIKNNNVQVEVDVKNTINKGGEKSERIVLRGRVKQNYQTYPTVVQIDNDERIVEASCECNFYKMNKLRKGACEHMLATRMYFNEMKMEKVEK